MHGYTTRTATAEMDTACCRMHANRFCDFVVSFEVGGLQKQEMWLAAVHPGRISGDSFTIGSTSHGRFWVPFVVKELQRDGVDRSLSTT